MANEAVIIKLLGDGGDVIRYNIGANAAIEKGTFMRLEDAFTVSGAATTVSNFVGFAASEKVTGDGSTTIGVYTNGLFDLKLATNSTCQAGDTVIVSGTNLITKASDLPSI